MKVIRSKEFDVQECADALMASRRGLKAFVCLCSGPAHNGMIYEDFTN